VTFKAKLILAQVPLAIALALVGGISATVTTGWARKRAESSWTTTAACVRRKG